MPEFNFCSRSSQPKIFFSICCLLSLVIVVITLVFGLGIGIPSSSEGNYESYGVRESRGKISGDPVDSDGDVIMMEYGDTDYQFKNADFDDQEVVDEDGNLLGSTKIRHQAHHGKQSESSMSLDDFYQKPLMSNIIESRLLHLDLKGAPPKLSYLKEVMKIAKKAGITGVLIEYEDTFPWKSSLSNISLTEGAYSLEEVEDLIDFAERLMKFEVIPLVQTFGHVEFILKGSEFRDLREVDEDPQSFCPSKSDTLVVIQQMIDQVLEVHKNARFIHIGCDEVANIRVCPLCEKAAEYKDDLFLKHVAEVARYVKLQKRIPIIWDDMLRQISLKKLNESGIGSLVEPMVWVYAEDVDRFVGWDTWEKYAVTFPTIWAAGAFKGAFGETLTIPPVSRHAANVDRWINVIARESPKWKSGVGGIVLTGWMRYDHFAVLAELLPATIPSLVYTSLVISVPGSSSTSIKNRMFVPKYTNVGTTTPIPSLSSSTSTNEPEIYDLIEPTPLTHISKRSPQNYRRKISHPRILMTKDRLSKLPSIGDGRSRELITSEMYDKYLILSREFTQIMHCPNYHTKLDVLLKTSDSDLSFASRCNFPGVAFFRTLFRLRSILHDIWEMVAKIQRKRAWATPYNIRHNYSLPSRVNEVIFNEVPKIRRQLELVIKAVETALRPIFRQENILEWIEQHIWDAWKSLDKLEKDGEAMRSVKIWPRRPVQSPWQMIQDLKLSRLPTEEQQDEL